MIAVLLSLVLAQDATPADPPPHPAPQAEAAPDAGAPASWGSRVKGADEVARLLKKWPDMKPEERDAALAALQKQYGASESNPVLPPSAFDFNRYVSLSPIDQARATARDFFVDLLGADSAGLLAHSGFPFFLEDHRFEKPEELKSEWLKHLRSKRTDLVKLYDLELLTPAEMEKKYGPPPRRLSSWNWRSQNTYVGVANLSGHAAIVLLRQVGAAWQVVAYHD